MKRLAVLGCVCLPLVAAESGATEPPGMIWSWLNFAILAGGLGYLIRKHAGPFFAARARAIRKGMLEADEARAEAQARMAEVDARLENLQTEIEGLRQELGHEEENERARMRQEMDVEIAKIHAHAEQEMIAAGKAARLELRRYAAQLALGLAEQKLRARMSAQDQEALIERFTAQV